MCPAPKLWRSLNFVVYKSLRILYKAMYFEIHDLANTVESGFGISYSSNALWLKINPVWPEFNSSTHLGGRGR